MFEISFETMKSFEFGAAPKVPLHLVLKVLNSHFINLLCTFRPFGISIKTIRCLFVREEI